MKNLPVDNDTLNNVDGAAADCLRQIVLKANSDYAMCALASDVLNARMRVLNAIHGFHRARHKIEDALD